jgi:hypothetical protein
LAGIADLTGVPLGHSPLIAAWRARLGQRLDLELAGEELSAGEQRSAREICAEKFEATSWNQRR